MQYPFLRVKIKSLAAEAKIIRREEVKFKPQVSENGIYESLHNHRTYDVRNEARSAQLAYGLLRGIEYSRIESKCYEPPNEIRIRDNVARFGLVSKDVALKQVKDWLCGLNVGADSELASAPVSKRAA